MPPREPHRDELAPLPPATARYAGPMGERLLEGRVALVTGASRGIGFAIAQRLASEGATIAVAARSSDGSLENAVAEIQAAGGHAFPLQADIGDDDVLKALPGKVVEHAGRLDILVNNAGSAIYGDFASLETASIDHMLRLYLRAPMLLAQAAIPAMRAGGCGWIVNVGSITALAPATPYSAGSLGGADCVYAAAKAGLLRFTQGLAAALLRDDLAVNMAAPSTAIRTPGADALIAADYPVERVEYLAETVLALCHRPAAERTGLAAFSLHYPAAHKLPVMTLDGKTRLPDVAPPSWRHPATPMRGDELTPHIAAPA